MIALLFFFCFSSSVLHLHYSCCGFYVLPFDSSLTLQIAKQAPKWGAHVRIKQVADATHDVLLSSSIIQDIAYNEIFNYFCYFFNNAEKRDEK
jgi:hypothetical protein